MRMFTLLAVVAGICALPASPVYSAGSDFDANQASDVLFQHNDDGRLLVWAMNNFARTVKLPQALAVNWDVVGKGDFNGDGTADVLYMKDDGTTAIAEMSNAARTNLKFPGGINPVWEVKGIGDFNGDGTDDVLWQRSTDGVTMVWGFVNSVRTKVSWPGGLASFWEIVGTGDFDQDGVDDILCQHNSDGRLLIWKMNNYGRASVALPQSLASAWTVVGVGDFNADGTDDVLYRKDTGEVGIAEFASLNRSAIKFPGGIGLPWSVRDVGDYNGDGHDDIFFQRRTDKVTLVWGVVNSARTKVAWPGGLDEKWILKTTGLGYCKTSCLGTPDDSVQNPDGSAARIVSHINGDPTYHLAGTRRTADNFVVSMDYLVHEPAGTPKALLVLIAGSTLNANIQGDNTTGVPSASGGNFLVRSAHLFAKQGYRVVTIDRPSDSATWLGALSSDFDAYRISVNHAVDLTRVITDAQAGDNLPVVIAGTSRGSISAVNQNFLADALSLSSPVTDGSGVPVGNGVNLPQNIEIPTHVLWNIADGCWVTPPNGAKLLLQDFPDVSGDQLDGGFYDAIVNDPCGGYSYHGFLGIESCAVDKITSWLDSLTFDASRPTAAVEFSTQASPINPGETVQIDLSAAVTAAIAGELTYSLPYSTTSLGGNVSLSGSTVTYTPALGITGTRDTFVYVVSEAGGGKAYNRVVIQIN